VRRGIERTRLLTLRVDHGARETGLNAFHLRDARNRAAFCGQTITFGFPVADRAADAFDAVGTVAYALGHAPSLLAPRAAIANAVYHATGRRVRDLPITLDKVMA